MQKWLIFSVIVLSIGRLSAQCPVSFYNLEKIIPEQTQKALDQWSQKGEFETTAQYQYRLQTQTDRQRIHLTDSITEVFKQRYIAQLPKQNIEITQPYDADNQTFTIEIPCFEDFSLFVPLHEARTFANDKKKRLKAFDLAPRSDGWVLSSAEIYSPKLKKSYRYAAGEITKTTPPPVVNYSPPEVAFEVPDFPLPDGDYDISTHLPQTKNDAEKGIAILIANQNYEKTHPVAFARNDVAAVRQYLIEVLGYRPENIYEYKDLTKTDFEVIFGSYDNPHGKLFAKAQKGDNDLFIYYSGHGAPGLNNQKAYFLPVNSDPSQAELSGYPLPLFLQNLAKIPARSKTVVIDACFSGVEILRDISAAPPVRIRPSVSEIDDGKTIVFTSSQSAQVSAWYEGKQHGLFTWFFLKALHDRAHSDANGDDKLTYGEIFDYVSDPKNGVPYCAAILKNGLRQTPALVLGEQKRDEVWVEYK